MYVETNKHFFWECHVTRYFWTDFHIFLNSNRIVIELSYKNISFGTNDWSSNTNIINCIIIIAKYFIFKTKYEKNLLSFKNFKTYLKHIENIENIIAISKDKTTQHRQQEVTGIVTKPDFPSPMALMPFLNSVIGWENFAYDMYKYLGTSK